MAARPYLQPVLSRFVFLLTLVSLLVSHGLCHVVQHHHQDHRHSSTVDFKNYTGETITWETGRFGGAEPLSGRELEYGWLSVPMDQFNPDNSGNKTFRIRLIRRRGLNATKNLILNPGGPGGSGVNFMREFGANISAIVGENYHLLSFDPRGTGGTRAMEGNKGVKRSVFDLSNEVTRDGPKDFATAQNFVKKCADLIGMHGKYINTPQTAADMSSILDALGQKDMLYWGFSYGSLLGQTYATMYPERSKRIIIDGVVNQFEWYGGQLHAEFLVDSETIVSRFVKECIQVGVGCPLASIANSTDQLLDQIMSLANSLREQPLAVYINEYNNGIISYEWFLSILFQGMKSPIAKWYPMAELLTSWLNGNTTAPFRVQQSALAKSKPPNREWPEWMPACDAFTIVQLNDAKSGSKYWAQDRKSSLAKFQTFINESLFTPLFIDYQYARQLWEIPRTHKFVPKKGVDTAHPLLILSTTFDPITPLSSAQSAKDAFEGSEIVEVGGYGHCSLSLPSKCVTNHIRQFLNNGTVPSHHTKCEKNPGVAYFPQEDESATFDDPEDERLHLAQLNLARQMAKRVDLW